MEPRRVVSPRTIVKVKAWPILTVERPNNIFPIPQRKPEIIRIVNVWGGINSNIFPKPGTEKYVQRKGKKRRPEKEKINQKFSHLHLLKFFKKRAKVPLRKPPARMIKMPAKVEFIN